MPGAVLPECPVTISVDGSQREGHVTDLLSLAPAPGFTALVFGDDAAPAAALRDLNARSKRAGVPFNVVPIARQAA